MTTEPKHEAGSGLTPPFPIRAGRAIGGVVRQLAQRPISLVGLIIVLFYLFITIFGPALAPYRYDVSLDDPDACIERENGPTRCAALTNAPPSPVAIFGTDRNGRDVLSRIMWGAQETIGLPTIATIFSVILGSFIGLSAGYLGGWYDEIMSRAMDSLLAIPALVLALVTISTIVPVLDQSSNILVDTLGATNIALVMVITLLYTPVVTRVIRSATLNLRDSGYVEAAKLRGETTLYIMFSEILPGVLPSLVVEASLRFSYAIFLVASLGFLGLGAQPPSPEWGRMVLDARSNFATAPWALWFPVAAIASLIISVNLLSDGLRRIFRHEETR